MSQTCLYGHYSWLMRVAADVGTIKHVCYCAVTSARHFAHFFCFVAPQR